MRQISLCLKFFLIIFFYTISAHPDELAGFPIENQKKHLHHTVTYGEYHNEDALKIDEGPNKYFLVIRSRENFFSWNEANSFCQKYEGFKPISRNLAIYIRNAAYHTGSLSSKALGDFAYGLISPSNSFALPIRPAAHFWADIEIPNDPEVRERDYNAILLSKANEDTPRVLFMEPEDRIRGPRSRNNDIFATMTKDRDQFNQILDAVQKAKKLCIEPDSYISLKMDIEEPCEVRTLICPLPNDLGKRDSLNAYPHDAVCGECDKSMGGKTVAYLANVYSTSKAYLFAPDLGGYCNTHEVSAQWQTTAKALMLNFYKKHFVEYANLQHQRSLYAPIEYVLENGQEAYCMLEVSKENN